MAEIPTFGQQLAELVEMGLRNGLIIIVAAGIIHSAHDRWRNRK